MNNKYIDKNIPFQQLLHYYGGVVCMMVPLTRFCMKIQNIMNKILNISLIIKCYILVHIVQNKLDVSFPDMGLKSFIVQQTDYFFIQLVRSVLTDSGNTFRTAISVMKQPSWFFKGLFCFIFFPENLMFRAVTQMYSNGNS